MSAQAQAAAAPSPKLRDDAAAACLCPKCQQPLIDPAGLGWCKACGYCRSLEAEQGNQLLATHQGPSKGAVVASVAGNVPLWLWVLLGGIGLVAGGSLAVGRLLPE